MALFFGGTKSKITQGNANFYCQVEIIENNNEDNDKRFIQFIEGELTHILPEDFGDVTEASDILYFHDNVTKIELPDSIISIKGMSLGGDGLEIIFGANIQNIDETVGILTENSIIDFSKAKQIPTIIDSNSEGNSQPFGAALEIRVPSNLYSEWIKAARWSDISSKIVAV